MLRLDVGDAAETSGLGCPEDNPTCNCSVPEHVACDVMTADPFVAMGLNCPGEPAVNGSKTGNPSAIGIRDRFGGTSAFDAREGDVFTVLGSGFVSDLDNPTPSGDDDSDPAHCNDDLGDNYDPRSLPPPLDPDRVGNVDCNDDPSLVGKGDCSNSLQDQWEQGRDAFCFMPPDCPDPAQDYTELRFTMQVPPDVISFSYDFAYLTTEWPYYAGTEFNDMFIGWLESEAWTGNISFDSQGNPISLNAAFTEYTSDAPELDNTCMRQHAATKWLTTTAAVTPGEEITVVFAIFDMSDSSLDSYVFLDNFRWGCEPSDGPITSPAG
jgi:hypothetical protein